MAERLERLSFIERLHLLRHHSGNVGGGADGGRRRSSPPDPRHSRVRRRLFGQTDHEENKRFCERELAKNRREASRRWNFDFESGRPREGNYKWEPASGGAQPPVEAPAEPTEPDEESRSSEEQQPGERNRLPSAAPAACDRSNPDSRDAEAQVPFSASSSQGATSSARAADKGAGAAGTSSVGRLRPGSQPSIAGELKFPLTTVAFTYNGRVGTLDSCKYLPSQTKLYGHLPPYHVLATIACTSKLICLPLLSSFFLCRRFSRQRPRSITVQSEDSRTH